MDGDVQLAQATWSQIPDPRLARQVRLKAGDFGVEVSPIPVDTMQKEQD